MEEAGSANKLADLTLFLRFFFPWPNHPIGATKTSLIPVPILAKRTSFVALVVLAVAFCGDYLSVRIRMLHPKPTDPFEAMTSLRILAIPEKNGKTEYETDTLNPQQTVTCVHSLFPHAGYSPCWYVKPRLSQPIPM
jgi:hypothetical protein